MGDVYVSPIGVNDYFDLRGEGNFSDFPSVLYAADVTKVRVYVTQFEFIFSGLRK